MRRNYFRKIVKYAKNVFNIEESLSRISDGRKNPQYKTEQVILIVLLGFMLRIRSFNELGNMMADGDLKNILQRGAKVPKIDVLRDTLKVVHVESLREMLTYEIRKARENKAFKDGTIDGLVVVGADGTQTYNSDVKECESCLKAFKKGKKSERNFHSSVVLTII